MATSKVTFTLDAATIRRLRNAAQRLAKPQSAVVREAIQDFYERIGKLSEQERVRTLRAFDELLPKIPPRPLADVERELAGLRRARRAGGRKSRAGKRA
ncbi:MAG TPA: ribbon-helix-helix protein, CopG family [Bryobacteraceae bacterium]|nr:ribbon-helix-helix protein, CopG family [Bryobacteraceae bacterium]